MYAKSCNTNGCGCSARSASFSRTIEWAAPTRSRLVLLAALRAQYRPDVRSRTSVTVENAPRLIVRMVDMSPTPTATGSPMSCLLLLAPRLGWLSAAGVQKSDEVPAHEGTVLNRRIMIDEDVQRGCSM